MYEQKIDLKGFWAWLVKIAGPMLTDENVMKAAAWLIREVLKRAVTDPEKTQDIIERAHKFVDEIDVLLAMIEDGDVPAFLAE